MAGSIPIAKDYSSLPLFFDIYGIHDTELCFDFIQVCEQATVKALRQQIEIERGKADFNNKIKSEGKR